MTATDEFRLVRGEAGYGSKVGNELVLGTEMVCDLGIPVAVPVEVEEDGPPAREVAPAPPTAREELAEAGVAGGAPRGFGGGLTEFTLRADEAIDVVLGD